MPTIKSFYQQSIDVPAVAASLASLMTSPPGAVRKLILQAPSGNGNLVFFGDADGQVAELAAGDPFFDVPGVIDPGVIGLADVFIKGTAPDKLTVMWTPDPRGL